jgi:ABC-type sugar transport system ATPase subunit
MSPAAGQDGALPPPELVDSTAGVYLRGLCKSFGDTVALAGLDLEARPGEILGIAGPNGAGKSTLVKILAGEVSADAGVIEIDGNAWSPAIGFGRVAIVHQEPQLFPNLTVGENIAVGRERGRYLRPTLDDADHRLLIDFEIDQLAGLPLENLPLAVQQRTEIARALAHDARVFLFDEPNSALTEEESNDLFRRMHGLADAGRVVMLVSHRLHELVTHSDRVAVVVDGRTAVILTRAMLTEDMLGRALVSEHAERVREESTAVASPKVSLLHVRGWDHPRGAFVGVDLDVKAGEIVAFVGVEGSGGRELVRSLAGFEPATGRTVLLEGGQKLDASTSFVSSDRKVSLFGNLTVAENAVSRLGRRITGPLGNLRPAAIAAVATAVVARFRVKVRSIAYPISSLSGGNQQKVAIAAAEIEHTPILVLEEPTRGVDLGSRREIHRLLRDCAAEGRAVVMYCTEVAEAFEAADLVHVVSGGRVSSPLEVASFNDVQELAAEVSRLERRAPDGQAPPSVSPAERVPADHPA